MTIDEARELINAEVSYQPNGQYRPEHGRIRRVNDYFAFVQYDGDVHAKATDPENLTLIKEAWTP